MNSDPVIKRLRIVSIITETLSAKTIVLEPLDGWVPSYRAGQFITFVFTNSFGEKRRSYSISSSSELGEPLSITFKRIENGEFSRPLFEQSRIGDVLHSSGISGFFILPEKILPETHFCFLAAGSGITPCFALIKTILKQTDNQVFLIYSNKSEEETIFYAALNEYRQQYRTRLNVQFLFSNSDNIYNKRFSKWLLEHILEQQLEADYRNTLFYICGPFEYMQTAEITLLTRITRAQIIKENFSSLPRLVVPKPPDTRLHQATVHVSNRVYTFPVQYPDSILAAAKKQDITLPYSCEAGRCGSCAATCIKGEVWMAYNEVLVDREVAAGRILTCQSFPVNGDVEIVSG